MAAQDMEAHPRAVAARMPDKPALIMAETGQSLSYADLVSRADRAAWLFESLGLATGDTIAIHLENQTLFPELVWAGKNSGLHYVAVSSHLNAVDMAYILEDCDARLLITSAMLHSVAADALTRMASPPHALLADGEAPLFRSYASLLEDQPAAPFRHRPRGASMLYSSGTTGRPKGVRVALTDDPPWVPPARHHMVTAQYGFGLDTVFLSPSPFYHSSTLRFMMAVWRNGGTVIGLHRFDASAALAAIARFRATHGLFVPTMFVRMLRLPEAERARADISSMRCALHLAAPCPVETKRAMIAWWGPVLEELYGGTESVGNTFISSVEWLAHPGSVGRPPAGCAIKIVDEAGERLPQGVPGRVMMSNGRRFAYHKDAAKTASVFDAEGFATLGDIGYLDAEGYLYLTDRETHMIITGGVNVYPQEAEDVLATHPAVSDVAVIGVPNADFGEEVKAVVETFAKPADPDALAAELLAFCRERLSAIKCPRTIDFTEALPRSPMGKLVKHALKKQYWANRDSLI